MKPHDSRPRHRKHDVASSYFTRPKGLHPTPSACFPPPPPAAKGTITGGLEIKPQSAAIGAVAEVILTAHNTGVPPSSHIDLLWTLPEISPEPPDHTADPAAIDFFSHRGINPGTYLGKVRCTWTNGQVRTFSYIYEITGVIPP